MPSLSYPRSAYTSSGNSFGRPGFPPTRGKSITTGMIWVWSMAFAPAVWIASGTPCRLTIRVCFVPGFRRSTGLGPVSSPPPNARTITPSTTAMSVSSLPAWRRSRRRSAWSRSQMPASSHARSRRWAVRP